MLMQRATAAWTVAQRDRLPPDGNKYEVLDGALLVTPSPTLRHQFIARALWLLLEPYVEEHALGIVFALDTDVIDGDRNEVVPDTVVYPFTRETAPESWATAPRPILVAEIRSVSTWRNDVGPKRTFYESIAVPDYWIVDGDARVVTVVRGGHVDRRVTDVLRWHPTGASRPLEIDVQHLLR